MNVCCLSVCKKRFTKKLIERKSIGTSEHFPKCAWQRLQIERIYQVSDGPNSAKSRIYILLNSSIIMQFEDILTTQTYPLLKDMMFNYKSGQLKNIRKQYDTYKKQMDPEQYGSYFAHLFKGLTTVVMDAVHYKKCKKQKEILGTMRNILQDYYSKINLRPYLEFQSLKKIIVGSKEFASNNITSEESESVADEINDLKKKQKEILQMKEEIEQISDLFTFQNDLQATDTKSFDDWLNESYKQ